MNMKIVIVEDEAAIRKGLAGLLPKISPRLGKGSGHPAGRPLCTVLVSPHKKACAGYLKGRYLNRETALAGILI